MTAAPSNTRILKDDLQESQPTPEKLDHRAKTGDAQDYSRIDLAVEGITCPACMVTIEQAIGNMPGISGVSLNYTTHRLIIEGQENATSLEAIIGKLDMLGYKGRPYELSLETQEQARAEKHLLRAMAVGGLCLCKYHDDVGCRLGWQ